MGKNMVRLGLVASLALGGGGIAGAQNTTGGSVSGAAEGAAHGAAQGAPQGVKAAGQGAAQGAAQGYTGTKNAAQGAAQGTQNAAQGAAQSTKNAAGNAGSSASDTMKGAGEQMKQTAGEVPAIPSDTAITDKINSTLPDTLKTDDVHVTTKDGVVTLTGSVGSQAERNRVLKLAGQTPGVERIRDQLEVAHGGK